MADGVRRATPHDNKVKTKTQIARQQNVTQLSIDNISDIFPNLDILFIYFARNHAPRKGAEINKILSYSYLSPTPECLLGKHDSVTCCQVNADQRVFIAIKQ
jgi:hypothetical protein